LLVQTVPQAPQLFVSVCKFLHALLQRVKPEEQVVTQEFGVWVVSQAWPEEQSLPEVQQADPTVAELHPLPSVSAEPTTEQVLLEQIT